MHRVQRAQLRNDEKQENDPGTARIQKVLPSLPLSYAAQGKQITRIFDLRGAGFVRLFRPKSETDDQKSKIYFRGMVSMVSMEVSKTLGPGSSPGTPAKKF